VLHEVTFRELWEAALVLDLAAVEQAVLRATPAVIAELDANIARTEAAAGDWAVVVELDTQWHGLVFKAAGNRVLQLAREPAGLLNLPATEVILQHVDEAFPRLIVAHREITDAIRKRSIEDARLWMRRHLHDWRRGFEHLGKDLDQAIDQVYLQSIIANERRR